MENKTTARAHEKRASKGKGYKTTKKDIEKAFSQKMVENIEKAISLSRDMWKNPCLFGQGLTVGPYNYSTGKEYDGVNVLSLNLEQLINGYEYGAWLTFNQIEKIAEKTGKNIHVLKGSKSTEVIFWKKYVKFFTVSNTEESEEEEDTEEEETEEPEDTEETTAEKKVLKTMWVLKSYRVFNVAQVEWDGYDYSKKLKNQTAREYDKVALASMDSALDFLTKNYKNGAPKIVETAVKTNCYMPLLDMVETCPHASFRTPEVFFSTLAHELGHSTGAQFRLNRKISNRFGSDPYAKEELVAETTALMCCASVGILSTYDNSIAYLKSWLQSVKENADSIVWAFKEAQKATSWILGLEEKKSEESEE